MVRTTRLFIPRDLAARQLSVTVKSLVRYEQMGLVRVAREGDVEGYEPSQVRRLWTIMSFQRDLGINLAGVEVILRLYDRMAELHHHLDDLASELRELGKAEAMTQSSQSRSPNHD